jgi:hypothetical protein
MLDEKNKKRSRVFAARILRSLLMNSPVFVAALIFFLFGRNGNLIILSFAAFIAGFHGIFVILRKEVPSISYGSIQGRPAVILGIVFTLLMWVSSLVVLFFGS